MTNTSKDRTLEIFTDGASKGNPGPAGVGVVIRENGKVIKEISKSIGEATNNVAEYTALIIALKEAKVLKGQNLKIRTDSELLQKQMVGKYAVKNENIKVLFEEVRKLSEDFKHIEIKHVLREFNKEADLLASSAVKNKQTKVVAALFHDSAEESPSSKG